MGDLKKIIEILESYEKDNGHYFNSILESDYENIAEEIVKLFAIPDVVGQSERLVCKCGLLKDKKGGAFSCMRTDCDMPIAN